MRASLGAQSVSLGEESADSANASLNLTASASAITDVDIAGESSNYPRAEHAPGDAVAYPNRTSPRRAGFDRHAAGRAAVTSRKKERNMGTDDPARPQETARRGFLAPPDPCIPPPRIATDPFDGPSLTIAEVCSPSGRSVPVLGRAPAARRGRERRCQCAGGRCGRRTHPRGRRGHARRVPDRGPPLASRARSARARIPRVRRARVGPRTLRLRDAQHAARATAGTAALGTPHASYGIAGRRQRSDRGRRGPPS